MYDCDEVAVVALNLFIQLVVEHILVLALGKMDIVRSRSPFGIRL